MWDYKNIRPWGSKFVASLRTISGPATGFDTDTAFSSQLQVQCLAEVQSFVFRYIALDKDEVDAPESIQTVELAYILDGGLPLGLVQHPQQSTWTAAQGTSDGNYAADNALYLGAPAGAYVWCDLEGFGSIDPTSYLKSWAAAVKSSGFLPAIYFGYPAQESDPWVQGILSYFYATWAAYNSDVQYDIKQSSSTTISNTCGGTQYSIGPADPDHTIRGSEIPFLVS